MAVAGALVKSNIHINIILTNTVSNSSMCNLTTSFVLFFVVKTAKKGPKILWLVSWIKNGYQNEDKRSAQRAFRENI